MQIDLNRFLFPAVNRATAALALGLAMAAGSANARILKVLDSLIRIFEVALRHRTKTRDKTLHPPGKLQVMFHLQPHMWASKVYLADTRCSRTS